MRKGFLFTLDALMALMLLSGAVMMYSQLQTNSPSTSSSQHVANDIIGSLNAITLDELTTIEPWADDIINETDLRGTDSILYAMAYLWVINDTRVDDLSQVISNVTPQEVSLSLSLEGETLYDDSRVTTGRQRAVSRQQITGIDQGKPVAGTSSTAYLKRLRDKRTSAFAYFGGFVGQGNISVSLELPADLNQSRINGIELELDTPSNFTLSINDATCGSFSPVSGNLSPDRWDLIACNGSLVAGDNDISLEYDGIDGAFVAGGYLKVSFTTDEFTADQNLSMSTYRFPRIDGVVNLYDAVIVPEGLSSMTIRLHYELNSPGTQAMLHIGEKSVWKSNRTGEVDITLTDDNLTILDYDYLSRKTVPIRFSAFNYTTVTYESGDADVVVITDYSGSMKKDIDSWSQGNVGSLDDCPGIYDDQNIRRTHLARCLDKEVVEILFNETANITGNRLWPVHYEGNEVHTYDNPEDREALISYYETVGPLFPQQGSDKTCISCALSEAYDIFDSNTAENRTRYVILMTDGLPTHCGSGGCLSTSSTYGQLQCEGYCDENGQNCNQNFSNFCELSDTTCDPAVDNALSAAQRLRDDFNTTIHTVGFGPVGTCDKASELLADIADIGNGTYQNSDNISALREIYHNISYSILNSILLDAQKADVSVTENLTTSTLFSDSYIELVHDPPTNPPSANEIEVTRQSPQFGSCSPSVSLPSGVRFKDAQVVSYSGQHWTDLVRASGTEVHNLSSFLVNYGRLGDPYHVQIHSEHLSASTPLTINIGDSPDNSSGCSVNNSLIYTVYVPSATARTTVLERSEGCGWTVELEDGGFISPVVPSDYTGSQTCEYTNSQIDYDADDAMQVAVYQLLDQLDFDNDGRIFVSLEEEDLEIIVTEISSVPYLWGPIVMKAEVER